MNILKNNIIAYTVNRVTNSGLYIFVQNGQVFVNAPWYLSNKKIQKIIEEKKKWITEKLREYENKNISQRNYIKNNVISILGEKFILKILYKNIKLPKLDVQNKIVKIEIPSKYKKMNNEDIINILLERMYDRIAKTELENIMEKIRITTGIAPEDYEIRRINNILATCTDKKTIIINPDIIIYNREVVEYIILHQFCHLKYKRHTKGFNEMINKYVPNYQKYIHIIKNLKY